MSASEESFRRKAPTQVPPFSEEVLVMILAVLFLVLHILAGTILQRAGAVGRAPPAQDLTLQRYD